MSGIENTLKERGSTHGDFSLNAEISQQLKDICRPYIDTLTVEEKESLEYILQKISRILTKGGGFKDDWRDIAGYAMLAKKALNQYDGAKDVIVTRIENRGGKWIGIMNKDV